MNSNKDYQIAFVNALAAVNDEKQKEMMRIVYEILSPDENNDVELKNNAD